MSRTDKEKVRDFFEERLKFLEKKQLTETKQIADLKLSIMHTKKAIERVKKDLFENDNKKQSGNEKD